VALVPTDTHVSDGANRGRMVYEGIRGVIGGIKRAVKEQQYRRE
jgi:hypothetical protein